jgi:F-type H+-transporting ATPase subunit c
MKALRLLALVLMVFLICAMPVLAQEKTVTTAGSYSFTGPSLGAGLGAGLTLIGAGLGFGRIGAAALEGMARQPEVAGNIQTGMIIIAALLEGATFFSLIVCIIIAGSAGTLGL